MKIQAVVVVVFPGKAKEAAPPQNIWMQQCENKTNNIKYATEFSIDGFNGNNINKRYCACACLWP